VKASRRLASLPDTTDASARALAAALRRHPSALSGERFARSRLAKVLFEPWLRRSRSPVEPEKRAKAGDPLHINPLAA